MWNKALGSKVMGSETMGSYGMKSARLHTKGFTLIAALLMLLLSGIAIGMMMMVNTEGKVGGTDLRNDVAFHAAEGGIETMYSNLALVFQNTMAPTAGQICAVGNTPPVLPGFTFINYSVMPGSAQSTSCPSTLTATWGQITGSGPNAGLWAQIIPVNMLATATSTLGGQEVSMVRQAQVALIPVFQFGVFSESDLSFFSGPNFDMVGPVHTNADLYPFVGPGSSLTFHNKLSAYGNVVRTQLANGWGAAANYNGNVYIPNTANGCSSTTTNCVLMDGPTASSDGDGSVTGAGSATAQNGATYNGGVWTNWSTGTVALQLVNGNYGSTVKVGTGAKDLKMPFVSGASNTLGGVQPFQIIRRPQVGESPASALAQSREWNLAVIHVELSDNPAEFLNGTGASDPQNVRLSNMTTTQASAASLATPAFPWGVPIAAGNYGPSFPAPPAGDTYNLYFATATNGIPSACNAMTCLPDWPYPPAPWTNALATAASSPYPLLVPTGAPLVSGTSALNASGVNTATVPTFAFCPSATVAPQGYAPYPASIPASCPATPVAPYYTEAGTTNPTTPVVVEGTVVPQDPATQALAQQGASWNLIDGWLRVEYLNNSGTWVPVTQEWLSLGFARDTTAPTASGGGTPAGGTKNPINPNAILLLQQPADRVPSIAGTVAGTVVSEASLSPVGAAPQCTATTSVTVGSGHSAVTTNYCSAWSSTPPQVLVDTVGSAVWQFGITSAAPTTQSNTQYNWYPINFYDAREGEVRDNTAQADDGLASTAVDNSCSTNGVMNAVEIDVGNLKRWLAGTIGTSGTSVNYTNQNGYVLYFSDRRGMLPNPNVTNPDPAGVKSGDAGLEDVVNAASAAGTPDGVYEPVPSGRSLSPEDTNENGVLDNFGAYNEGLGFYTTVANVGKNLNKQINSTGPAAPDPFGTAAGARIASCINARKNWVSGARHVLRLVDGSLGNVPTAPGGTVADPGGFTVASENPVYVWGDYNTNSTDTAWNTPLVDEAGHSSAAVIADTVTFLSDSWNDYASFGLGSSILAVTDVTNNRVATSAWYRVAVAGGKNINFPQPTWTGVAQDFGTDGGVHNFLRYLENWNGSLNYMGSIVSLYYSTYDTGVYKCCNVVYNPPTRNYIFDLDFSSPQGLPPGTPMFRDVNSLGYREMLTTRTD